MSSSVMPAPVQATSAAIETKGRSVAQGILRRTTSSANSTSWSLFSHKTVEVGGEFLVKERQNDGGYSAGRIKYSNMRPPCRATPGSMQHIALQVPREKSESRLEYIQSGGCSPAVLVAQAQGLTIGERLPRVFQRTFRRVFLPSVAFLPSSITAGSTQCRHSNPFLSLVGVARSVPIRFQRILN